jgi:hypothetical protein
LTISNAKAYRCETLIISRMVFVDGTPEVEQAGGELVGKSNHRNDSTVRRKPKIEIGFEM